LVVAFGPGLLAADRNHCSADISSCTLGTGNKFYHSGALPEFIGLLEGGYYNGAALEGASEPITLVV